MCGNTFFIGSQPENSHKDPGSEDESDTCNHCERESSDVNDEEETYIEKTWRDPVSFAYACDQCETEFTAQGSLRRHKLSKHEQVRWECDLCGKCLENISKHLHEKMITVGPKWDMRLRMEAICNFILTSLTCVSIFLLKNINGYKSSFFFS